MPSIFVSYRHSDASAHAGRLYDRLAERFGEANVFRDIDSMKPGADFAKVIKATVGRCDALIAVIGKDWLAPGPDGASGLHSRNDWVRVELVAALTQEVRIVPVLVGGATLPPSADLPKAVRPFTQHHAVSLTEDVWALQVTKLIDDLEQEIAADRSAQKARRLAAALPDQPVRLGPRTSPVRLGSGPTRPRVRPRPWRVDVRKASDRTRVLELRRLGANMK